MAQIMIKRQMKALFGVSNSSNDSVSPTEEECSATKCQAKPLDSTSSLVGKKRKHSSLDSDGDDESSSLPSLELEDALSELDSDSVCDSSEAVDGSCDNERDQKRRKKLSEFSSDLIVVLDMDECLIHFKAQQEDEEKENNGVQENSKGKQQEQQEQQDFDANKNNNHKNDPSILYVNEHQVLLRPGLVEFLKFVTTRFQTHIFTAGTQEYADSILDQLSQLVVGSTTSEQDIFCKRWYRDDCDTIDILNPLNGSWIDSIYVKPLSKVAQWAGRDADDLSRIVHIDDQPKNFLLNHSNGIIVTEWRGENPKDDQVLSNVTKVLEKIDTKADVRPHLMGESYLALKDHLDLLHLFPHRRTKGIGSTLLA